jgi:hypothetical protein
MTRVIAVLVTRHRRESLAKSLAVIAEQTRLPDHLVVVDNGPDDPAEEVVGDCPIPSTYLLSLRNLGGAGGFALGILHALALGADWVWLADDDGRPADVRVLQTLLEEARRRDLAVVSPVVVNIDDPERLAFPLRRGLTWKRQVSELGTDFLPGIASFFNGALFSDPGCGSEPHCGPRTPTRTARLSSSRCSAGTCTPRIPPTTSSATTPTATAATCCPSRGCGGSACWKCSGSACTS